MVTKVAVITGASSGIGEAMAWEFSRRGFEVALIARRTERIDALAASISSTTGLRCHSMTADVCRAKDLEGVAEKILQICGRIDVVVANAGFGVAGLLEQLSVDDYRRQFDTNIFGVLHTFKAFIEALKRTKGHFAIVGSVNSYVALPGGSAYAMSKFAVRALAKSLSFEMAPYGVSVTLLCPGFVESEIRRVDNRGVFKDSVSDPIPAWIRMGAKKAARQMIRAILRRRTEAVVTTHGKIAVCLERHFPGLIRWAFKSFKVRARAEPVAAHAS